MLSFSDSHLYLGFHGCEKSVAEKVILCRKSLAPSINPYDWLGKGCYFWEGDPERAIEFAKEKKYKEPFVIGAVLDLKNCLDLTCRRNAELVKAAFDNIVSPMLAAGKVKTNVVPKDAITDDLLLRFLDCAVIESLHDFNEKQGLINYDSVRAGFWEGKPLYQTAGFREKNHIQICIRNPECIIGLFLPAGYAL